MLSRSEKAAETICVSDNAEQEMLRIPAGNVVIGDPAGYPNERQTMTAPISEFWIDKDEVSNKQYAQFVAATGYITVAERPLDPQNYPSIPSENLVPGSAIFAIPDTFYGLAQVNWWRYQANANWKHPKGPNSNILGKGSHPVVHIAYQDAQAYADWKGHKLPSEAQWKYAANAGAESQYAWGAEYAPSGIHQANTWQGAFPMINSAEDGYSGTAPIGCFPANKFGLHDMIGNVWEWTSEQYSADRQQISHSAPDITASRSHSAKPFVIKGGSHLCAENYCLRYRPAARQPQDPSLGTSHLGFRTVRTTPP